jgi:hypothetical protein
MNGMIAGAPRMGPSLHEPGGRGWNIVRWAARILAGAWALFAFAGIVGDALATLEGGSPGQYVAIFGGGLAVAALAALPWRWELGGGVILTVIGGFLLTMSVVLSGLYDLGTLLVSIFIISLPPLVAGVLFLAHALAGRNPARGETAPPI